MPQVTTTKRGFRVEDVTFRGARRQSEILNEIDREEDYEPVVKAPVSLTPEQVIDFYKNKINAAHDSNERRVYSQTIVWIKELLSTKKSMSILQEKLLALKDDDGEEDIVAEDAKKEEV